MSKRNHPGIIDLKGKSYVFGLNYELWRFKSEKMGQKYQHKERRSVGLSEMKYNADGTIQKIDYWPDNGMAQLEGNTVFTNLSEGKYTKISGVEFGDAGDFDADYWEFEDTKTSIPQGPFCKAKTSLPRI